MQPLKGLTVVTLEHAIAAPFATRQLADLGARVIKIERPGVGDFARGYDSRVRGLASHFVWTNRSKESLTLDVKHPEANALLKRLVLEQADVLIQNLAPGAAERLGMGYDTLSTRKPGLIVCDISGYGDDPAAPGPYRDKKAYDLLIQSESGLVSVTGTPDEPCKAGPSIADIAAGMYAYSQILAALLQRGLTGRGQRIDISMLESLTEWTSYPLYYAFDGQPPPPRTGAAHATIYPYGPFPAGDGGTVMLGLQNEREWVAFCAKVLLQPELATDPRFAGNAARVAARDALRAIIVEAFARLTAQQVVQRLEQAQIANARVNTMAEVWDHPQLQARGRWRTVDTPAGPVPALLPPGSWTESDPRMDAVPALGQHTDTILASLGLDADAIARLRSAGAV
jgi:itaconate CoA-transferase